MTTTTTQSATTNGSSSPTSVQRVINIPVVADTLNTVHSTIQSNSYSKAVYEKAEGAAQYIFEQSKPYHEKLSGPISQVDGLANKGLDFVQAKAPYVFEAKTDELISKARQPADQAYAYGKTYADAATARLAPITEQVHARLTQSSASLHSLQEKLATAVRDPKTVQEQAKGLSEQVLAEVEKIQAYVSEKRKELPTQAQNAVAPLIEKLQQSYSDIKSEISKTDVPLRTRATNVLAYSREQANPIVHEALEALRHIIGKAEKKTDEAVNGAKETANAAENKVNGAKETSNAAESKVNGA